MCSTSASIDSNRAVECKVLLCSVFYLSAFYSILDACVSYKSGADKYFLSALNRKPSNSRFCYMVKPHEQLVLVSSTRRRASTPNLSTS